MAQVTFATGNYSTYQDYVVTNTTHSSNAQMFHGGTRVVYLAPEAKHSKWKCAHCGRKNNPEHESCVGCGAPDLN